MGCAVPITPAWQCVPHGRAWKGTVARPGTAQKMLALSLCGFQSAGTEEASGMKSS